MTKTNPHIHFLVWCGEYDSTKQTNKGGWKMLPVRDYKSKKEKKTTTYIWVSEVNVSLRNMEITEVCHCLILKISESSFSQLLRWAGYAELFPPSSPLLNFICCLCCISTETSCYISFKKGSASRRERDGVKWMTPTP